MDLLLTSLIGEREKIDKGLLEELEKELSSLTDNIKVRETDIGRGASWPVILITIGGIFFLGKKINENLEAWILLGKKFGSLIKRIKRKFGDYRIDEKGASLIAIKYIVAKEKEKVFSIENISQLTIPIICIPGKEPYKKIDQREDALYIQIYKVNDFIYYVFAIKSSGTIDINYRIYSEID